MYPWAFNNPIFCGFIHHINSILSMKKSARLEKIQQMLKNNAEDAFLLFALAKEFEKLGEDQQALDTYSKLKATSPNYVGLYYHLGKCYERLEQIEKAFFTYKEGIKVGKAAGDQHAVSELAGAKLNLGDDEDFE